MRCCNLHGLQNVAQTERCTMQLKQSVAECNSEKRAQLCKLCKLNCRMQNADPRCQTVLCRCCCCCCWCCCFKLSLPLLSLSNATWHPKRQSLKASKPRSKNGQEDNQLHPTFSTNRAQSLPMLDKQSDSFWEVLRNTWLNPDGKVSTNKLINCRQQISGF